MDKTNRMVLLMGLVAVLLGVLYFFITDERTMSTCTACLKSNAQECAVSKEFQDADSAKTAAKTELCAKLYPPRGNIKIISCLDTKDEQFSFSCNSQLKRIYRPLVHVN